MCGLQYFNYEEIKIGYGYCKYEKYDFAVYHCFLIFNNFVIDTTLPKNNNLYYIVEYLKKIDLNKGILSLDFDYELCEKKMKIALKLLQINIASIG